MVLRYADITSIVIKKGKLAFWMLIGYKAFFPKISLYLPFDKQTRLKSATDLFLLWP